ncbi:hypothetical protein RR48_10051 [Papilio machaon]|uniref:F-box domain-containing protein n=1 Tax=Papilio machaon TaxID=76193 RepID=A0A194R4T7_PAPMA|nr:hypothetical protein RR48_10051 [Papilio machaon]
MGDDNHLCALPAEIVVYIFSFLSARELIKCRQLSIRLKEIVDSMIQTEALWRQHCKSEFSSIYQMARYKSKPGLLWYNIYKSLKLWSKLAYAREDLDEFASASELSNEISNVIILRDGLIGVHTRGGIVYYHIETLDKAKREDIRGTYLRYMENDDMIVVLSYNLQLFIIRKTIQNPRFEPCVKFDNVKTFLLIDEITYYVTLSDDIYECKREDLTSKRLEHSDDGVMSLSYSRNKLHILTFQRSIYSVNGKNLVLECTLGSDTSLLDQLSKYNFLESLDWRIYNQWMYVLNHNLPHGPLRDIIKVRMYGDVVFVGSNWGVLRIYYAPYTGEIFDLYNAEPVRQFNFIERYDCPVLSNCPIIQIDVSEREDGHTVIVAMPKKIAVLNLTHNFKRTASVAMLPYHENSKMKVLKIKDFV